VLPAPFAKPGDTTYANWLVTNALAVQAGAERTTADACIPYLTSKYDYLRYDRPPHQNRAERPIRSHSDVTRVSSKST
jgi:hypothetical protein